jgi:predicted TIM-barrel fold metal-dependent hydrolase
MASTDWPHDDSRFPHSIDSFLALPHLSSETQRKVLWDNCARLYNLQPVSVESPGGN